MSEKEVKVAAAEVVVKESAQSVIVREDGERNVSLDTVSPVVAKGDKGLTVELDGHKFFVREPYAE